MKKISIMVGGIFAVLISAFVYRNQVFVHHFLTLISFGKYIPGFKTYGLSCSSTPLQDTSNFYRDTKYSKCFDGTTKKSVRIVDVNHNETMMRTVLLDAVEKRCPVVVRHPFRDHKCFDRLKELSKENFSVRVKENTPEALLNTQKWFPSEVDKTVSGHRQSYSYNLSELLKEYEEGHSLKFTAFDTSLTGKEYQTLWDTDISFLKGRAGSTFLSNYNTTFITTTMHSAFWDSFGYQCEGKKLWKVMTPEDAFPTVRLHHMFTLMKDCNGRADIEDAFIDVITEADDLFFFPPFWAHSVKTDKGLSVLLNYRKSNVAAILRSNLQIGLLTLVSGMYYGIFHSTWDPDEVSYYYFHGKRPDFVGHRSRVKDFMDLDF